MRRLIQDSGMRFWPVVLASAAVGLLSASVVLVFRWTIEVPQTLFLPAGQIGNYDSMFKFLTTLRF
jgi:hypothetical protein